LRAEIRKGKGKTGKEAKEELIRQIKNFNEIKKINSK